MEAADITKVKTASDPQLSPDGRYVAFVVTSLSQETDAYHSAIWLAETATGHLRQVTAGDKRDTSPRWSPDSRRLAFLSDRDTKKKTQLFVLPLAGGEARCVASNKQGVSDPVWSPDGDRLAFRARVGGWEEPADEAERAKSKPARIITTLKHKMNGEGFTYDRNNAAVLTNCWLNG